MHFREASNTITLLQDPSNPHFDGNCYGLSKIFEFYNTKK